MTVKDRNTHLGYILLTKIKNKVIKKSAAT